MDDTEKKIEKTKNWGPGGGMYRGVKVPVKTLNYIIAILMVLLVVVVVYLANSSHYTVTLETNGGNQIEPISYKYGDSVNVSTPLKTGYTFENWYVDKDLTKIYDTSKNTVSQSMTLYASWKPSTVMVKFDVDGGTFETDTVHVKEVVFEETYGVLPVVTKPGYQFIGWQYNGQIITRDTVMNMNGEHD